MVKRLSLCHAVTGALRHSNEKSKISKIIFQSSKLKNSRLHAALSRALKVDRRTGISRKTERSVNKKDHFQKVKDRVLDWFKDPENSSCLPGKKDVVVVKGVKHQKYLLQDYLSILHRKFLQENPDITVSFSTFTAVRRQAPWIKLLGTRAKDTCLCSQHENMRLRLRAVRGVGLPNDLDQCTSTMTIENAVQILKENLTSPTVTYSVWKPVKEYDAEKNKTYRNTREVQITTPRNTFIADFAEQLLVFRAHQDRAITQYRAVHLLKDTLPPGHITIQMDFAENWATGSRVQSSYYGRAQLTVHPAVAHYKVEGKLQHHSLVVISSERQHNAITIYAIMKKIISALHETLPIPINHVHYISDSPSSQYRNISIFSLISRHSHIFKVGASWIYMESGHGKGPCDGVGAVVKRVADDAFKAGHAIQTAEDFVKWGNERTNIEHILLSKAEVEECDQRHLQSAQKVPGTMKVHHAISPIPGILCVRNTACCAPCCFSPTGTVRLQCSGWSAHTLFTPPDDEYDEDISLATIKIVQEIFARQNKAAKQPRRDNHIEYSCSSEDDAAVVEE